MSPNPTSATIATMVIMGRLIAKSEISIKCSALLPGGRLVVRCGDAHRRACSDALRGADQEGVSRCDAADHFVLLRVFIPDAQLHLDLLRLAVPQAKHPGAHT